MTLVERFAMHRDAVLGWEERIWTQLPSCLDDKSFAPGAPYGLGLSVFTEDDPLNPLGESLIGHDGDNPGTSTRWQHLPDYDVTIFAAVNRNDIPEGPTHEPPLAGGAVTLDMLAKAIDAVVVR